MESTTTSSVPTTMNPDAEDPKMNQCVICYFTYNRTNRAPVSMPCGHTFCRQCCIRQTAAEKLFTCGVCRKVSLIGLNGTEKNLALLQILENLNLLDTDDSVEDVAKDSNSPLEMTKQQAEVVTDAMQTLAKFIKQKFSENDEAADILEKAVSAVDDVFECAELDSDDDDRDEDNIEDEDDNEADNSENDDEDEVETDQIEAPVMPQTFQTLHGFNDGPAILMGILSYAAGLSSPGNRNVAETGVPNNYNAAVRRAFELAQKEYPSLAANNPNNDSASTE